MCACQGNVFETSEGSFQRDCNKGAVLQAEVVKEHLRGRERGALGEATRARDGVSGPRVLEAEVVKEHLRREVRECVCVCVNN